jgi:hypothetical protein
MLEHPNPVEESLAGGMWSRMIVNADKHVSNSTCAGRFAHAVMAAK